jgi:hypothetical protein
LNFLGCFIPCNHQKFIIVALDAPGQGLELAQVDAEGLNELFEHDITVCFFFEEVNRYVHELFVGGLCVSCHKNSLLFFALGHREVVVSDRNKLCINPAVSHR